MPACVHGVVTRAAHHVVARLVERTALGTRQRARTAQFRHLGRRVGVVLVHLHRPLGHRRHPFRLHGLAARPVAAIAGFTRPQRSGRRIERHLVRFRRQSLEARVWHAIAHLAQARLRVFALFGLDRDLGALAHQVLGLDLDHAVRGQPQRLEHELDPRHPTVAPRQGVPGRGAPELVALRHLHPQRPAHAAVARQSRPHLRHPAHVGPGRHVDVGLHVVHVAEIDLHRCTLRPHPRTPPQTKRASPKRHPIRRAPRKVRVQAARRVPVAGQVHFERR